MKNFQIYLCLILQVFIIFIFILQSVNADCKKQVPKDCEPICFNRTACEIRIVVILPDTELIESSINRVRPVLELAKREIYEKQLISRDIDITFIDYDDKCEASYSTIYSMDAYGTNCAHLIIGPSCDYALATVARIIKHFRYDGMPLITPAGYTHDYIKKKTDCDDEYYMLTRTGLLSYARLAEFTQALAQHYNWTQVVYFYERNGRYNVAGLNTCYLLISSLAEIHRKHNLVYKSFATDSTQTNMTENLKREVGVDQAKCANTVFHVPNHEEVQCAVYVSHISHLDACVINRYYNPDKYFAKLHSRFVWISNKYKNVFHTSRVYTLNKSSTTTRI